MKDAGTRERAAKGKAPAYQWYPGDWRRDTAVQSCSLAARGLWREMLDLMHDGTPRGYLATPAGPIGVTELARLAGASVGECRRLLAELERKQIFSRTPEGVIFSRRMVRDTAVTRARAEGGKESLKHPNVPRPKESMKDRSEDGEEGYPSDRPSGESFGGSPASATASASAGEGTPSVPSPGDSSLRSESPSPSLRRGGSSPPARRRGDGGRPAEAKSAETWRAYADAYTARYGVPPVRNGKTNALLAQLVDRLGAEEAPQVAAWYVSHPRALYVAAKHAVDLLVRDAEGLRTEWATGRIVTTTQARQADQTATNAETLRVLLAERAAREADRR